MGSASPSESKGVIRPSILEGAGHMRAPPAGSLGPWTRRPSPRTATGRCSCAARSALAGPGRQRDRAGPRGRSRCAAAGSRGMRPFCDGSHKLVRFRAPSARRGRARAGSADALSATSGREQRGAALLPRARAAACAQRPSSSISARAPHRICRRERRLLAREAAGEVDRGDRLVDGVGGDVLVEEVATSRRRRRGGAARRRSGGWGPTRSSRTARGGRRSRRASGGAGRTATSG